MIPRHSTLLLLCFLFTSSAFAQFVGTPYVFEPAAAPERLGANVAFIGDVSGNGFNIVVVGSPAADPATGSPGRLRAFDARTMQSIWTTTGTMVLGGLGTTISQTPDIDGDGFEDIVATERVLGSPYILRWYSGATGAPLNFQWLPAGVTTTRHPDVIPWRDWNGNGTVDYAVADYRQAGLFRSVVIVDRVAGVLTSTVLPSGSLINPIGAPIWSEIFGSTDLNADGIADLIVGDGGFGSSTLSLRGRVDALDGTNLQPLWALDGTQAGGMLGSSLTTVGDLDNDGVGEVLAGEPWASAGLGRVRILSGATGQVVFDLSPPALTLRRLGQSIVNVTSPSPGLEDTVICGVVPGDPTLGTGPALVRYRFDPAQPLNLMGVVLREIESQFMPAGSMVSLTAGDVNSDGVLDHVLGVDGGSTGRSSVHVFRGSGEQSYSVPNPSNQTLLLRSFPTPSLTTFVPPRSTWNIAGPLLLAGQPGLIVAGLAPAATPILATTLLVDVTVSGSFVTIPFQFGPTAAVSLNITASGLPIPPWLGFSVFTQAFAFDPTALQGLISSNGLQITL